MIEASLATNGYKTSTQSISNDRGVEYQLFSEVTRDLATPKQDDHDYHSKVAIALNKNMRLWSALATQVSEEENQLPRQLRASIFYLADFTRNQTTKIYSGDATPDILIEINTMMMRGLRAKSLHEELEI